MNKAIQIGAISLAGASFLSLGGCATPAAEQAPEVAVADKTTASATASFVVSEGLSQPTPPTRILDEAAAQRLLGAKRATLQWISWDRRGSVNARMEDGVLRLTATQSQEGGPGRLFLDGYVSEIGADYFTFEGKVQITGTPDRERTCEADKSWRFAVTQNRPYWRLREFEWCDYLTDYVDIYW
ncbi:hypothetical protein ACRAQ7_02910 [Erythrobacter sp. W53]|uniref:hypothetical protein n=1 Tax=Erythrobacter sp. W53 TaxID=3425947 RepID=UPI003D76786C